MATNLAQLDHSWENGGACSAGQRYMQADVGLRSIVPQGKTVEPCKLDVLGVQIEWKSDGRDFPASILSAITSLYEFADLDANWDSHGGKALNLSVVAPTLRLLFACHHKGITCTRVVPLPSGGVGLRWSLGSKEIEVDIYPGIRCDVVVDDEESGLTQTADAITIEEAERIVVGLR